MISCLKYEKKMEVNYNPYQLLLKIKQLIKWHCNNTNVLLLLTCVTV